MLCGNHFLCNKGNGGIDCLTYR